MQQSAKSAGTRFAPVLRYRDVAGAVDWLCGTFGFKRHHVVAGDAGVILYAHLTFGQHMIMVLPVGGSDLAKFIKQPDEIGGAETQSCYIVVEDADAHYRSARAAGADIILDINDDDHGGRGYACRDPEGHIWSFGTYDPWQGHPGGRERQLGRGVIMAVLLVGIAVAAGTVGWMLPRPPNLSADEIQLQRDAATARERADSQATRASVLAGELAQERGAKDAAERAAREARELLAQEQGAKRTMETGARQLEERLGEVRRVSAAAEQRAKEAGDQIAAERTAREAAQRTVSDATQELARERDAKQRAERSAQDTLEQLAREQRAREDAERTAKEARDQLAQAVGGAVGEKTEVEPTKEAATPRPRPKKADEPLWDCRPRAPSGQVICYPRTGKQ
jgi:uncharacterized glyoxalase superfamily protein PhnB